MTTGSGSEGRNQAPATKRARDRLHSQNGLALSGSTVKAVLEEPSRAERRGAGAGALGIGRAGCMFFGAGIGSALGIVPVGAGAGVTVPAAP